MKASRFLSSYLKAEALKDDPAQVVTISRVSVESIGQGKDSEDRLIVFFKEMEQGLILNATNGKTLTQLFGDETDRWVGQRVELSVKPTTYKGQPTVGLRLGAVTS